MGNMGKQRPQAHFPMFPYVKRKPDSFCAILAIKGALLHFNKPPPTDFTIILNLSRYTLKAFMIKSY